MKLLRHRYEGLLALKEIFVSFISMHLFLDRINVFMYVIFYLNAYIKIGEEMELLRHKCKGLLEAESIFYIHFSYMHSS